MSILRHCFSRHVKPLAPILGLRSFSTMAKSTLQGHLLCIIPFPEPTPVLERIRLTYPNLKVSFAQPKEHIPDSQTVYFYPIK